MKNLQTILSKPILYVLILFFTFHLSLEAQEKTTPVYLEITKVKKTNQDFMDVQEELIHPFIQEKIKQGKQLRHHLFKIQYPYSDEADHDYMMVDVYQNFEDIDLSDEDFYGIVNQAFPNNDVDKMTKRYKACMKNKGSEVFRILDEAFPGIGGGNSEVPEFAVVNFMQVKNSNNKKYVDLESSLSKPIMQARAKAGNIFDWLLMRRVLPYGKDYDHNFITVDVFSNFSDMNNQQDMDQLFKTVHPTKDVNAAWKELVDLRVLMRSEVWKWVAVVDQPTPDITYSVVKEGSGAHPMKGHEVFFKSTISSPGGATLFSSDELGFPFNRVLGADPYERFLEKGVLGMKKGGIVTTILPAKAQGKMIKSISGGKTVQVKIELVDFAMPKANGTDLLATYIKEHGLEKAKLKYQALKANNPKGYVFRESDMNTLGYQLMKKGEKEAAIYVFDLNQKNHPTSWNACDSLADGYRAASNYPKAKDCYQMALKIKPDFMAAKNKLAKFNTP